MIRTFFKAIAAASWPFMASIGMVLMWILAFAALVLIAKWVWVSFF